MREYFVEACSGASMDPAKEQTISVIDVEGGQAAMTDVLAGIAVLSKFG